MSKSFTIRLADQSDYSFLVKWSNDCRLRRQQRSKKKTNGIEQKRIINALSRDATEELFVIEDGPMRKGACELYDINYRDRTCKLSVFFDDGDDFLATSGYEVIDFLIDHAFFRLGLFKISADVRSEEMSYRVLLKQGGFSAEVLKRKHLFEKGRYLDIQEWSLLKSDLQREVSDVKG